MKRIALFLLIAFIFSLTAQEQVVRFRYDQAGNRISRITTIVIPQPSIMAATPDTTSTDTTVVNVWGDRKIVFYPNPTRGNLNVRITGGTEDDNYEFRLVDNYYSLRSQGNIKGSSTTTIPMEGYHNGIYFLNLFFKRDRKDFKVIKE